jgi:DNA replication protein DnaC
MSDLATQLRALGMHYTAEHLDDLVAHATKSRTGPRRLLERIAAEETKEKQRRGLVRRLTRSKLGHFKTMADFEWKWPRKINRAAVESALELDFLGANANVVLVAPEGLGKTMIAKNIVHNAILAGHTALFISAAELLLDLAGQESARALERRLKHYARVGCLCIDEIGYLSYDTAHADLLFQLVSMRYEKKPLVLTTNLPFKQWPTIFPGAGCTVALIDRVVHHAEVITVEGDSYRLREAKASSSKRRSSRRKKTAK